MAKGLTRRQRAVLEFIIQCIRDNGCPPTIAEICEAFGIQSTNGVNDHLVALEKKGFIERSSKARGIRVTELAGVGLYQNEVVQAPLLGRVAAGQPLLAEENIERFVPLPPSLGSTGLFCLRVTGESMIEVGILEGDILVVDSARQPKMGDIVVALVDNEATVKRYFPKGRMVELQPANAAMSPLIYPAANVLIQGVAVGLQRFWR